MNQVEDLVARFLELREEQPELDHSEFASSYPDCAPHLKAAIEHVLETLGWFPAAHGEEGGRRTIGGYELLREIGRGGMGVVFEACREGSENVPHVALKILPLAGLIGERALRRFEREVRILERLDHKQIVAMREFGTEQDSPYLVMDLIDGQPLSELVGKLSPLEAAQLIASLARAVHAAHEGGVLHRDIKPQNVIVDRSGVPVLLDFGLTAACDEVSITSSGDLLGTPPYMSPEQARGEQATVRSDVNALGLVLYELVAGHPAFDLEDRSQLMKAVERADFIHPSHLRPSVSPDLVKILSCATAWNAGRRYGSAAALAEDLERFVEGQPVFARRLSPLQGLADHVARRPVGFAMAALAVALGLSLFFGVLVPALEDQREARVREVESAFDRAVAYWIQGRAERCTETLEQLFELDPEHPGAQALHAVNRGAPRPAKTDDQAQTILEGLELERAGQLAAAREQLMAALEREPASPWAVVLLARHERRAGNLDAAQAELVAGSQLVPNSLAIAHQLAALLNHREEYPRAEREYRRAIALLADDPYLWHGLSLALFRQGRDEEALDASRRAMEFSGRLDPAMANTVAAILDKMDRFDEAQEILRRLVHEHPDNVMYCYNLAYSLDSEMLIAEAKPLYERVLKLQPGHMEATACLAWLLGTAADPELLDVSGGEQLLLDALQRDRGRSERLVLVAQAFAKETGRIERLSQLFELLVEECEVDERFLRLTRAVRSLEQLADEQD